MFRRRPHQQEREVATELAKLVATSETEALEHMNTSNAKEYLRSDTSVILSALGYLVLVYSEKKYAIRLIEVEE